MVGTLTPIYPWRRISTYRRSPHQIAAALRKHVGGGITEVVPSLQHILVEGLELSGPFQENIGQFVAALKLSDHPIAISVWDQDSGVDEDSDPEED